MFGNTVINKALKVLISIIFIGLSACSSVQNSVMFDDLPLKRSEDLLSDSISLPFPDNEMFTTSHFADSGLLFGEINKSDNERMLAQLNVDTGEYTILKEIGNSHLNVIASSEKYIFYLEVEYSANYASASFSLYIMDLVKQQSTMIFELDETSSIFKVDGTFYDDYLFYIVDEEKDGKQISEVKQYNLTSGSIETLVKGTNDSLVILEDKLFTIHIDNINLKTELYEIDLRNFNQQSLFMTDDNFKWINYLGTDDKDLFIIFRNDQGIELTKFDFSNNKVLTVFENYSFIENPKIVNNYMYWLGEPRSEERQKSQYYLYDIENHINVIYDQGPLLISRKGIIWIEFKKNDYDIPKGKIFIPENSEIRYIPF